jgi:hypothetical protein
MRRVRVEGVVSVGRGVVPEYVPAKVLVEGLAVGQRGKVKHGKLSGENDLGRIYI